MLQVEIPFESAALFVAVLVLLAAARLMKRNIDVLMDRAPADAEEAARAAIARIDPPVTLRRLRMRQAGPRQLMDAVCQWTNEKKYRVNKLLTRLIDRCDQLNLHIKAYDPKQNLQVSAYVTTLVMNHLFTGRFKRTK